MNESGRFESESVACLSTRHVAECLFPHQIHLYGRNNQKKKTKFHSICGLLSTSLLRIFAGFFWNFLISFSHVAVCKTFDWLFPRTFYLFPFPFSASLVVRWSDPSCERMSVTWFISLSKFQFVSCIFLINWFVFRFYSKHLASSGYNIHSVNFW